MNTAIKDACCGAFGLSLDAETAFILLMALAVVLIGVALAIHLRGFFTRTT